MCQLLSVDRSPFEKRVEKVFFGFLARNEAVLNELKETAGYFSGSGFILNTGINIVHKGSGYTLLVSCSDRCQIKVEVPLDGLYRSRLVFAVTGMYPDTTQHHIYSGFNASLEYGDESQIECYADYCVVRDSVLHAYVFEEALGKLEKNLAEVVDVARRLLCRISAINYGMSLGVIQSGSNYDEAIVFGKAGWLARLLHHFGCDNFGEIGGIIIDSINLSRILVEVMNAVGQLNDQVRVTVKKSGENHVEINATRLYDQKQIILLLEKSFLALDYESKYLLLLLRSGREREEIMEIAKLAEHALNKIQMNS